MKKNLFILFCVMFVACGMFAQESTTVKITVNQADALELDASGEPATVGDTEKFEVKGGTLPYQFEWVESNEEEGKDHKVTVKDANNCTVSIYVNVMDFNSLEEITIESNAYPNPTSDIVHIPVTSSDQKVTLLLINSNGLVLYKNTVDVTGEYYPLSLNSCPTGRYFIQVVGNQTKTYSVIKK
jgi:hypothetical protein